MKKKILQFRGDCLTWTITKKAQITRLIQKYGQRTLVALFFGALLYHKDVQVQIGMDNTPIATMAAMAMPVKTTTTETETFAYAKMDARPAATTAILKEETMPSKVTLATGLWSDAGTPTVPTNVAPKAVQTKWKDDGTLANTYSNLTYTHPKFSTKNTTDAERKKLEKQLEYVKRFAQVAKTEMDKFGIPASITLAQGLLESNVGESRLSTNNNNHFGVKCFSRSCGKGHCSNFTDDSHKDFFRKYFRMVLCLSNFIMWK